MTSKILSLEQKVWQYIRRNKKFIFGNVMLVTGIGHKDLIDLLEKYEELELIKPFKKDGGLSEQSFIVIQKLPLEIQQIKVFKLHKHFITALKKVLYCLRKYDKEVNLYDLDRTLKLNKNQIKFCIEHLIKLEVLTETRLRTYTINVSKMEALLTFYKQKRYEELEDIINGKMPLFCVPLDLVEILKVVIENEALQRSEIIELARITRKNLMYWWHFLEKSGVVIDSLKESIEDDITYIFNAKRAKKVLEYINTGSYEKNKELKQLWLQ